MRLLTNENFPLASVRQLRELGHDVLSITESKPGISDEEVLSIATQEKRVLVTFDGDYGELLFLRNLPPPPSVVYLRFAPTTPEEPAVLLQRLLTNETFSIVSYFVVLDRLAIRRRPLRNAENI